MKRVLTLCMGLGAATFSSAQVLIDNFSTGAYDSGYIQTSLSAWTTASGVPGSIRMNRVDIIANPVPEDYRLRILPGMGMATIAAGPLLQANTWLGYGFANGSMAFGSNSLNLNLSASPKLRLTFRENDQPLPVMVQYYNTNTNTSAFSNVLVPSIPANTLTSFDFDFSTFASISDVDTIFIKFSAEPSADFVLTNIAAVPEPTTIAGLALAGLALVRRRRQK